MIGCCAQESIKFMFENGTIDTERLTKTIKSIELNNLNTDQLEAVKKEIRNCDCPCHIDGAVVLC
jgi:hypothetical protein